MKKKQQQQRKTHAAALYLCRSTDNDTYSIEFAHIGV